MGGESDDNIYGFKWSFTALNISLLSFLVLSIVVGLIGNIAIIGAIFTHKILWRPLNLFIINLSCADLVLVGVISCTSITGLTEGGYIIFLKNHKFCNVVANICVTVCVVSLLTHMIIAITRYCSMRYGAMYEKMFTTRLTIVACLSIWIVAFFLQFPPNVGWGRNVYDRKAMICIWDRTYSLPYTLYFAIVYVFIPISTIFYCYIQLFFYIRKVSMATRQKPFVGAPPTSILSKKDANSAKAGGVAGENDKKATAPNAGVENGYTGTALVSDSRKWQREVKLARTLFSHFALVFILWGQYAFLVIGDHNDELPLAVHAVSIQLAHSIAVFNVFIYLANKNFRDGMIRFIIKKPLRFLFPNSSSTRTTGTAYTTNNENFSRKNGVSSVNN